VDKLFFVYILTNRPRGVLYVGVTGDLARRITVHKDKLAPGFSERYGLAHLVHYEEYPSIVSARAREQSLKRWRRAWKIALVEEANPDWRDLSNELPW
jgi:putative endonuclease